jgi:hypothetical protein
MSGQGAARKASLAPERGQAGRAQRMKLLEGGFRIGQARTPTGRNWSRPTVRHTKHAMHALRLGLQECRLAARLHRPRQ